MANRTKNRNMFSSVKLLLMSIVSFSQPSRKNSTTRLAATARKTLKIVPETVVNALVPFGLIFRYFTATSQHMPQKLTAIFIMELPAFIIPPPSALNASYITPPSPDEPRPQWYPVETK